MTRLGNTLRFVVLCVLASSPSLAQDFTAADLAGNYDFSAESGRHRTSSGTNTAYSVPDKHALIGTLSFDGVGGVTGARKWFRPRTTQNYDGPTLRGYDAFNELIEQEFTGTYVVAPTGAGVMTLAVTPSPEFMSAYDVNPWEFDTEEIIHFTAADGGQSLKLVHIMKALTPDRRGFGTVWLQRELLAVGAAQRQTEACMDESADPCELVLLLAPLLPPSSAASSHPCLIDDTEAVLEDSFEGARLRRPPARSLP